MQINGEQWFAYVPKGDSCKAMIFAFSGAFSGIGAPRTFYDLRLTGDLTNGKKDEMLFIQVTDVENIGTFNLLNSYKEYHNYAKMLSKQNGTTKTYINKKGINSFTIEITEFIDVNRISFKGIKGKIHGVLYNELDQADSILISNGSFSFPNMNGRDPCDD